MSLFFTEAVPVIQTLDLKSHPHAPPLFIFPIFHPIQSRVTGHAVIVKDKSNGKSKKKESIFLQLKRSQARQTKRIHQLKTVVH